MDETEELIYQIGLLLTQTRFARRALEDIERETATYATFAFTSVIAAGARFGQPPLVDGALKVHVVNINDLGPGGGFGALIEGLLGGAGRFVGNLLGGVIGGTISTPMLIEALPTIERIAQRVERILTLLGIGTAPTPPDTRGGPVGGSNLIATLESIRRAVDSLTGLFLAAGGRPEEAARTSPLPSTPEGERWQRFLATTTTTLEAVGRAANGLTVALPIAIGAIAWFISRLGEIRVAIAETLQFLIRNLLLLRGSLLVTVFDALALVARMAARTLELLAGTLTSMLSVVFDTVREALLAVLALAAALGTGIKTTIDALLNWIVPTIHTALRDFGDTRAFRVVTHLVRILPAILPPIYEIAKGTPLGARESAALATAAALPFPGVSGGGPGGPPATPTPAPDIARIFEDLTPRVTGALGRVQQVTTDGLRILDETGRAGLGTLAERLDRATIEETQLADARLGRNLDEVRRQSRTLAEAVIVPERLEPQTGLEAIANAYEGWLAGGGLNTLLGSITRHFSSTEGGAGVPQRIVEGSFDRPRATVQIDEVLIELEAPPPSITVPPGEGIQGPGDFPLPPEGDDVERFARSFREFRQRGGDVAQLVTA